LLGSNAFADLLDQMPHRVRKLDRRRILREPGSPPDEVILAKAGILSMFQAHGAGRQTVALRYAGEAILPGSDSARYGVQAIVPSEVILAEAGAFCQLVDGSSEMRRLLIRQMQRNEAICYEWLVNCGRRDAIARVAHFLCETAFRLGGGTKARMVNPFTQQQMGEITGQTSVNVNRVLAELERQNLITRKGREIEFRDWSELCRIASFRPDYLRA